MAEENSELKKNSGEKVSLYKRETPKHPHKGFSKREIQKRKENIDRIKKKPLFYEWKNSRYWFPRVVYALIHGVWIVFMAIGGFIAWLIATLFI